MNVNLFAVQNSELNVETTGSLDLKIARLERQLRVLNQQQLLSQPYPDHRVRLAQMASHIRFQLVQLRQYREKHLISGY